MAKTVKKEKKTPFVPKTFRIRADQVERLDDEELSQKLSQSSFIRDAIDLKFPPKKK